jgi:aminoglycoside/choline kinase family phosphotransferase
MIGEHCGLAIPWEDAERDYLRLAEQAFEGAPTLFMHRDYQSRNLMLTPAGLAVIDFQGARLGPPEYDLASLLYDPYTDPAPDLRERMVERYLSSAPPAAGSEKMFRRRLRASAINRTLQILGAFAYLGGHLQKPGFLEYAPAAWRNLRALAKPDFPHLLELADRAEALSRP